MSKSCLSAVAPWSVSPEVVGSHYGVKSKGVRDSVLANWAAVKSVGGRSAQRSPLQPGRRAALLKGLCYLLITFCIFI